MKISKLNLIFSIVLYNTSLDDIYIALDSINSIIENNQNSKYNIKEVYICDNSKERTFNHIFTSYKKLSIIYNHLSKNLGYGSGHNFNFSKILSYPKDYFFVAMNPDIRFEFKNIESLFNYLKNINFSCASPLIYLEDGSIQYSAKENPTFISLIISRFHSLTKIKFFREYLIMNQKRYLDYKSQIINANFLSGCFLVFNPDIYELINGFDEKFFLHFEDADITRRCSKFSQCFHYPHSFITHKRGRGSHKSIFQQLILLKSYISYILKWGFKLY